MTEVKYEPMHKHSCLDKLAYFVFRNPTVYFSLLILISLLILFLQPHTIVFKDSESDDVGFEESSGLSDFHVNLPNYQYLKRDASPEVKDTRPNTNSAQCRGFRDNDRFDCFPQENVTEEACNQRGCCWAPVNSTKGQLGIPYCYYPSNFKSYRYANVTNTDFGVTAYLEISVNSSYPDNVQLLRVNINYLSESILSVKITDANNPRFVSPVPELPTSGVVSANCTSYVVDINKDKLGFNVIRKSNNQSIFNSQDVGGFVFADQLLQLSARLPSHNLYGLGQQRNDFLLDTNWRRITLFNHDREPADKVNLYGSHPFYLALENNGLSSGVFLSNPHAMDIILQPTPAITYRAIGGEFDFYFMLGPSPAEVLQQYTSLVGRPFMPPYWSLGFHLCRFGYNSLEETMKVWNRTRAAGIPFDTQWNDIDYMERRNDFTYDKVAFKGLPQFVDLLHKEGMHYIVILDPGVSAGEKPGTYPPYDEGLKQGIFVKDPVEDKPFLTKVWNDKGTVFPDFSHLKTESYWQNQISEFHKKIHFDGLWIDMNEPSTELSGGRDGCAANKLDYPPYVPAVEGGNLFHRTICMSARHAIGPHYHVHNLFGLMEATLTTGALRKTMAGKRPFVISRASYPSLGHYTGVWTGDVQSTWDDMAHSISDVLSFSLFGIPMSGADICGFNGNTTVELCQRWSQLGAFYPFSRNHNSIENSDQDPVALGPVVVEAARNALLVRYSLLPYLYTLFWHAHTRGDTVARPMFVEFPKDDKTYTLHSQFLWGSALLIAPILSEEKTYATAYLPHGRWYDFYSFKPIDSKGSTFLLPKQKDSIPLLLHGGSIIPTQRPNTTTTASRKNPLGLIVCLCNDGNASGALYWDDGDTTDFENGVYNYVVFTSSGGELRSTVQQWQYQTTVRLADIVVLGVEQSVTKVVLDGHTAQFIYKPDIKLLNVTSLSVDLSQPFTLSWS